MLLHLLFLYIETDKYDINQPKKHDARHYQIEPKDETLKICKYSVKLLTLETF